MDSSNNKYQMVTLEEACDIITDGTHQTPTYVDEGITFLSSKNVKSGRIDWQNVKYVPESLHEKYRKRIQPKMGDLLLAKNGTTGVAALIDRKDIEFSIYVSLALLRPSKHVDPEFLLRILNSPLTTRQFNRSLKGVGVPNLHLKEIRKAEIPLPPIAEQKRIAGILDAADALRVKRRDAIASLYTLLQSTFLTLFGDPITNPMGWDICPLENATTRVTDGTHQSPKWSETGIPFLFVSNIRDRAIDFQTSKFISEDEYTKLTSRCPIEAGDILYTTVGSYGNPALVKKDYPRFAFQRHIAHIKPKHDLIDPKFLEVMLDSPVGRYQADRYARGVAQKTLNLRELKRFKIFLPPFEKQQHLANIVSSIEKQKAQHRAHLAELDTLFASLQSRAFNGEL